MVNATKGTPAAEHCEALVGQLFAGRFRGIGQYNRRYIAGTRIWSEHSWANALDIMVGLNNFADGDVIYAWLAANKKALGIRVILWRVASHYDHIHVDFWPRGTYTPPTTLTGLAYFRYSTGRIVRSLIQAISPEGPGLAIPITEDDTLLPLRKGDGFPDGPRPHKRDDVVLLQNLLARSGWTGTIDGKYGDETTAGVKLHTSSGDGTVTTGFNYDNILVAAVKAGIPAGGGTVDEAARQAAATAQGVADAARNLALTNSNKLAQVKGVL